MSAIQPLLDEYQITLTGAPRRLELPVPGVGQPIFVESLVSYDQFSRSRQHPPALKRLEPLVRAVINYGHKLYLVPEVTKLEGAIAQLLDGFAGDWVDSPTLEDVALRLAIVADSQLAILQFLRGE